MEPGDYEYKFIVDNVWYPDVGKELNSGGNNSLHLEETFCTVYENINYPRSLCNKFQKKLAEKYPELYLEKRVFIFF